MEPATFRLVAQCLNQLRYRVPLTSTEALIIWKGVFLFPVDRSPYRMISAVLSQLSAKQYFFI